MALDSITIRGPLNEGNALIEITFRQGKYQVAVVETPQNLYDEHQVHLQTTFAVKPTTKQILTWLKENKWITFNLENLMIEDILQQLQKLNI